QLWCRAEVHRLTAMRAEVGRARSNPGPEGSIGKLAAAELHQDIQELCVDLLGLDGLVYGDPALPNDPRLAFLNARQLTIAGGTTEVMRNTLGERVLGLPADVRVDKNIPWRQSVRGVLPSCGVRADAHGRSS